MAVRKKLSFVLIVAGLVAVAGFSAQGFGAMAAAGAFRVDSVHSTVVFRVKHNNVSVFNGRFDEISGTVTLDEQNPAQSAFEVKISTGSVDTAAAKRDNHLKSPDFLNARQFPTITFKSKSVSKSGDNQFDVQGDLTLHGVTKPITLRVTRLGTRQGPRGTLMGLESVFTIKRSEFGMGNMLQMIGDEVQITVDVEAIGS